MLKELINRLLWHPKSSPKDYVIIYLHRGAPDNKKSISVNNIIINDSFLVFNETHIPFHRILEIKNLKTGEILYKKVDIDGLR
ncbi:Protein of unknown function DUF504 [Methanococcus vannielii SB]|jgi:uncharacterized protein (UPF0248 family)|uniref:UPF0248 protein Mevan_1298 n=1 Tax=Methanococcus vannielii (strain ATCC 35089 / DSM 1224 / JCM 13029 / OCM 148 / SB) TaxID=406327 RepID=Y1298_METVS|nr:DUF504 domain-containing protein [Methanococcus vannielii]A6URS3.1 RecName: Full=UPF0248 protein Mevan_1298 [Methanococcus vannielii SB]ABR55195.1 Protein of unknown function DUF504 [Methanococcus vannielii SB]